MAELVGKHVDSPDEVGEFIDGKGLLDRPVKQHRGRFA
jgi:hypothetical protein